MMASKFRPIETLIRRTVKTFVGDLKRGDHILHNDRPVIIDSVTSVQKGRGCRTFLITAKELGMAGPGASSCPTVSIKPSSREHFDVLEMRDTTATFLYREGDEMWLMEGMEEVGAPTGLMTDGLIGLIEAGEKVRVKRAAGDEAAGERIVAIIPGNTLKCTVVNTMPQGSSVVAVMASGGRVICPSIVSVGDQINVDSHTGQYLSRVFK